MEGYECDFCLVVCCVEEFLKLIGIGDICFFGLELEFFFFDDVCFYIDMVGFFYKIDFFEVKWNFGEEFEGGNMVYCFGVKGGYFLVLLVDFVYDICVVMCLVMEEMGFVIEVYYYEVVIVG